MKLGVLGIVLASLVVASCGGDGGGRFVGKWDSVLGGLSLDLRPDHTAQISDTGIASKGTWEMQEKDRIVVHRPTEDLSLVAQENGELADALLGRFIREK